MRLLFAALALFGLVSTGAQAEERGYRLADPAAQPVVRVLVDSYGDTGRYRNGTGVLVGRCDVLITARHIVDDAPLDSLQIYSPQIRGRVVSPMADEGAAALRNGTGDDPMALDEDVAVLRLAQCPTHHFVSLEQVKPMTFGALARLRSAGFPCDSARQRAPELVDFTGSLAPTPMAGGLSRQVRLTPGARPGQSGAPVFGVDDATGDLALHMILVATVRDRAAPVGCGIDAATGQSEPGHAAFGAILTEQFIADLSGYIDALYRAD